VRRELLSDALLGRDGRLGGLRRSDLIPRCLWAGQVFLRNSTERGCLLKGIAEGTYNSKHAEAARLYYTTTTTTTTTHIHTHTHLQSFKLGHAHERRCEPNHREQQGTRHIHLWNSGANRLTERRGFHFESVTKPRSRPISEPIFPRSENRALYEEKSTRDLFLHPCKASSDRGKFKITVTPRDPSWREP